MVTLKEQVKRNYELSKKLSKEYNDIYGEITIYLRASKLSDVDAEDAISDILSMIIDGQERNATIEEMFGDNLKGFCDNIINSYNPYNKKSKFREFFQLILIMICIGTFWGYVNVELPKIVKGNQPFVIFHYSLAMLLNTIIMGTLSLVIVKLICKSSLELNKNNQTKFSFKRYFPLIVLFIATTAILVISGLFLGTIILFTTKIHYVLIFMTALFLINKLVEPKVE